MYQFDKIGIKTKKLVTDNLRSTALKLKLLKLMRISYLITSRRFSLPTQTNTFLYIPGVQSCLLPFQNQFFLRLLHIMQLCL